MTPRYIARSSEIAARLLGDEMIIMSVRDSTLFTLNPVATVIWEAADGTTSLRAIVEGRICAEFEISPDTAYRDAEIFVVELARHGILLISDEPFQRRPDPAAEGAWAR